MLNRMSLSIPSWNWTPRDKLSTTFGPLIPKFRDLLWRIANPVDRDEVLDTEVGP